MSDEYKKLLAAPIRKDRKPLQDIIPLNHPLRVLIDPCDICNFKCEFCFQCYDKKHKGNVMQLETFDRIIEQLKEFGSPINIIHLYGFGEPLLNPNLPEMIKRLKKSNVCKEIAITTNGSLLTEMLSEQLIESGLTRLSISLNGLTDDDFVRIANQKVSFDNLYKQINYFYNNRKQCHLHVKINGECFENKDHERFVKLFSECTDSINIDHVVNIWPGIDVSSKIVAEGENNHSMYDLETCNKNVALICPQMFYEIAVHSDGSVSPCCADCKYETQNLGNIFDSSLLKIWNGNELKKMRYETIWGERSIYQACNECDYPQCGSTVNLTMYREELKKRWQSHDL